MGDFDTFFQADNTLKGTENVWRDADTLEGPQGEEYRIQGFEAPEIAKFLGGQLDSAGQAGGWSTTTAVRDLANSQGFTNIVKTGELDPFGRELVRLQDEHGRDFTQELLNQGIATAGRYNTQDEIARADAARAFNTNVDTPLTDWDAARMQIEQSTAAEMTREQEFKETALNEAFLATGNPRYSDGSVQIRRTDRDLDNHALNPLSEGFDVGLTGVQESLWGVLEMAGTTNNWEWAQSMGDAGIGRARAKLSEGPALKLSAFDENGEWDIDGVGEFFEYLGTNAAVSLPYMAATVGGTIAAPFTGGLSLTAPVAIYTGQTWNEMEGDKNAAVAIAAGVTQAALDRLGLKGLVGGSILKKETRDAAIAALMKNNGVDKKTAVHLLADATRKEIAQFAGDAGQIAKQQLDAGNILRAFSSQAAKGALTEGATEALQEATAYSAAVIGSDKAFDRVELVNRLMNAVVAGGSLGAGFSIPGVGYDTGAWADVAVRQAPADQARRSRAGHWAQQEVDTHGRVQSIQELNAAQDNLPEQQTTFEDKVNASKRDRSASDVFGKAKEAWASVPGLWQGATRFIFKEQWQDKSRALRILADKFGGNLQRTFSGVNFENRKHHLLSEYKNLIQSPANYAQAMGLSTVDTKAISKIAYNLREYMDENGNIDWNALPADMQQHRPWLGRLASELKTLGDKLHNDQAKYNPELGYLNNYLFRYKSFNKAGIEKNRNGFIQALVDHYGYSRKEASDLTNAIVDSDFLTGESDFHVGAGKHIPGAHRQRDLNLADNPYFDEFMENDLFANISNAAKSASRYVTYQEFLGENNAKVNQLLDQAIAEGVPASVVNNMARQLQDYLDAESGNYKRIENQTWNNIQKNLMFWTTVAGLPLATLSSFVELALTSRALTASQIGDLTGNIAKEGAQGIWDTIKNIRPQNVGGPRASTAGQLAKEARQQTIKDLGYFNWDTSAGQTIGATEFSHTKQIWLDKYFRLIGLQQWTDYTRSIRASMGADFIFNHMETIKAGREAGQYTNEVLEAEEHLRNLGLNIEDFLALNEISKTRQLNEEEVAAFDRMMNDATFNFINEAVALPQVGNRPIFYQNPHFALFTQFQGFIATFTANHIPRLWGEYVKRGTPSMKYNAFAVMATMLVLGAVSQHLKDLLKYGKPTPYLDDVEKLQRTLNSSGLIGTFERPLGFLFPLYESSSDNAAEWFFQTVSGEAAALSNVSRAVGGAGKIVGGDTERGVYDILKTAPGIGPLNQLNRSIASFFG